TSDSNSSRAPRRRWLLPTKPNRRRLPPAHAAARAKASALSYREHRAAAAGRAAVAHPLLARAGAVRPVQRDAVVVGNFLARPDGPDRLDEDAPALLHGLAVGFAGVVDPAR